MYQPPILTAGFFYGHVSLIQGIMLYNYGGGDQHD